MPTDLSRLISSLNNSKVRGNDPALYQVIFTLIKELQANKAIQGEAAPTTHATTHYAPGTDPVDILQLAGYTGTTTDFLRADGTWQLNSGSGINQLTGDVTAGPGTGSVVSSISNGAVTTVKVLDANITYAKIQDVSAASRLLGRGDSGSGDVQEITLGANLSMTGTTLSATSTTSTIQLSSDVVAGPGSGLLVSTIQNNVVTFAKFQTCSESRLVGRGQGSGAGNVQEITIGSNLSLTGTTLSATGGGGFPTFVTTVPSTTTPSTANTVVDATGMSFSLATGSWLVWGAAVINGVSQTYAAIYITNTTNTTQAAGQSSIFVANSNVGIPIGPFLLVVPSTQTYKMRFITGANDSTFLKNDTVNTTACSFLAAMQVA